MIEAAAIDRPILYMSNSDYQEPLSEAVKPLVESFVQGHTCQDMMNFLNQCKKGIDMGKESRAEAFKKCIPAFDGLCGERILNDIIMSIESESIS